MYCVMRASVPSLYNVYRRYDYKDTIIRTCDAMLHTISIVHTHHHYNSYKYGLHFVFNCVLEATEIAVRISRMYFALIFCTVLLHCVSATDGKSQKQP